jgi:ABC-type Na+ efflux pump permease subunit
MMPVTFISGMFDYVPPHSTIGHIAALFPVSHILQALLRAFGLPGATGPLWEHLGVVALWGVVCGVVAVRRFRWAPRR